MRMKGFTPREFEIIAIQNGFKMCHCSGSHRSYRKEGTPYLLTFPYKGKELSRPLLRRLIKEANLIINT